jgi:hypothetical protein
MLSPLPAGIQQSDRPEPAVSLLKHDFYINDRSVSCEANRAKPIGCVTHAGKSRCGQCVLGLTLVPCERHPTSPRRIRATPAQKHERRVGAAVAVT